MNIDPFNTADTRFDEMSHHLADYCDHAGVGKACRACRRRFDVASQWTRDYLTQQEPTDDEVQAFQYCLYERTLTWVPGVEVRAALSAARAASRNEESLGDAQAHHFPAPLDYLNDDRRDEELR